MSKIGILAECLSTRLQRVLKDICIIYVNKVLSRLARLEAHPRMQSSPLSAGAHAPDMLLFHYCFTLEFVRQLSTDP